MNPGAQAIEFVAQLGDKVAFTLLELAEELVLPAIEAGCEAGFDEAQSLIGEFAALAGDGFDLLGEPLAFLLLAEPLGRDRLVHAELGFAAFLLQRFEIANPGRFGRFHRHWGKAGLQAVEPLLDGLHLAANQDLADPFDLLGGMGSWGNHAGMGTDGQPTETRELHGPGKGED